MFVVRTSLVLLLTLGSWRTGVDGAFLPASVQALDADADALDASDASDAPQVRLSGAPVNYALLQYSPYEAMPVAAFKPSEPEQYYPIRRVRNQTHPAGFNYHTSNTELAPYVSSLPINHGQAVDSNEVEPVDRTLGVLLSEIWPVAFSYAKWAVVRSLIFRPATKAVFGPIFSFLSRALFPLGIDRFILTKWIPYPILTLIQSFLYRRFEHMVFRGVTGALSFMYNTFFKRR